MRVALVHDYLNQYGGAERVLEALVEIFPKAPIYTLFYDKAKTHYRFDGKIKGTSFLDKKFVYNHHRVFIPLMPLAANLMNLGDKYDLIISDSAGYAKGINYSKRAFHICYCHTPLRYAWEYHQYFKWSPLIKAMATPALGYLRWWDKKAAQKPDIILANSYFIAYKIKQYYQRDAEVLYPPVDLEKFYKDNSVKKREYFLAVGRMLHYKHFDLIIQAFNKLNLPLRLVGEGPQMRKLRHMAQSDKIDFIPFVDEDQLRALYNEARALIFPQVEDFGLVAAEAQACGTPVIAFSQGGAREIVKDGITGFFFHRQTPDDLAAVIEKFSSSFFDAGVIQKSAEIFSKKRFQKRIFELASKAQS